MPRGGHYPRESQTPERVPRTCVFWHVLRGCLSTPVDSNESEALYLNYVTVSSKCHLKRLRRLLNPFECQALFLRKAGHCQACSINMVFLVPEFQGQAEARCGGTLPGFLEEPCGVAQRRSLEGSGTSPVLLFLFHFSLQLKNKLFTVS